jgi:cytochrome c-type biogenesis protein CcmH/NrfG
MSSATPPPLDTLRQQITAAFERGADAQALSLLQSLCRQSPDDADVHYRLGGIEEQIGSPTGARSAYLQCVKLAPTNAAAYLYGGLRPAATGVSQGRRYLSAGTVFDEAFAPLVGLLNWTALDLFA